jgi:hypothetical protein
MVAREFVMAKKVELRIPELAFIISTRVALGVGIGLLAGGRMNRQRRRRTGWTLLAIGAATTVPIVMGAVQHRGPFRLVA